MKPSFILSWAVRLLFLAGAAFLALGGPLPPLLATVLKRLGGDAAGQDSVLLARIMPGFSPLAALSAALAGRSWHLAAAWCAPFLAVLLLAFWRGRFFCRHVCPAGTCYTLACKTGAPRKTLFPWRISGFIFWGIAAGAAAGLPLLLPLDPLATFNRALLPARFPHDAAAWIAGVILPLFLVLGALQPMLWCGKFCPLGYLFDLVRRLRPAGRPAVAAAKPVDQTRREILGGAAVGLPLALLFRRFGMPGTDSAAAPRPVLPPGAGDLVRFSGACTRCYACVQQCPTGVIRVRTPQAAGLGAAFLPLLDMDKGACAAFCNACTRACPAGALRPMPVDEKDKLQIGIAKIDRDACLAWTDGEHCMVCQEFCPYGAIADNPSPTGIPRPVVNPAACRGCGACQKDCPAIRKGKAVIIHGVERHLPAKDAA